MVPAAHDQYRDRAERARIFRWERGLGVSYEFASGDRTAHVLGPDDRILLDRLGRAGKLSYFDADVRARYGATLSPAGKLFGSWNSKR
jgi:hypothetical protein